MSLPHCGFKHLFKTLEALILCQKKYRPRANYNWEVLDDDFLLSA